MKERIMKSGVYEGYSFKQMLNIRNSMDRRKIEPLEYVNIDDIDTNDFQIEGYDPIAKEEREHSIDYADVVLKSLDEELSFILRGRFGIGKSQFPQNILTLGDIAETLGVTRERVRQLEAKALMEAKELLERAMKPKLTSILKYTDAETEEERELEVTI